MQCMFNVFDYRRTGQRKTTRCEPSAESGTVVANNDKPKAAMANKLIQRFVGSFLELNSFAHSTLSGLYRIGETCSR